MSNNKDVNMLMMVDFIKFDTYKNAEGNDVPIMLLKGSNIEGNRVSANIRYGKSLALKKKLEEILIKNLPLEEQKPIVSLQGELVEHSFKKNEKTIRYNRLETQSFIVETGINLEFIRQQFSIEKDKRDDMKAWKDANKLKSQGLDIEAYTLLDNYLKQKIESFQVNNQLDKYQPPVPESQEEPKEDEEPETIPSFSR